MKQRVVITGLGVIAPNGVGKRSFWDALKSGSSGISHITRFDPSPFSTQFAGEAHFDPSRFISAALAPRPNPILLPYIPACSLTSLKTPPSFR